MFISDSTAVGGKGAASRRADQRMAAAFAAEQNRLNTLLQEAKSDMEATQISHQELLQQHQQSAQQAEQQAKALEENATVLQQQLTAAQAALSAARADCAAIRAAQLAVEQELSTAKSGEKKNGLNGSETLHGIRKLFVIANMKSKASQRS